MSHASDISPLPQPRFLPMSRAETQALGWDELDVLLVTGDAYVDHPTFGAALLGRWLVAHGFRVGLVAQPDWHDPASIQAMGRPRLLAGVTAGALDSMLAHYTAFRRRRSDDAYTPGGQAGARPDRASIVYTNLVKQAFPGLPVVLGGIEASLRRVTHYDFWSDKLRRSILLDAKADAILYGMAENSLLEVVRSLAAQPELPAAQAVLGIPGTAVMGKREDMPSQAEVVELPSHEAISREPAQLMTATLALERQVHQAKAWAAQEVGGRVLLLAPPSPPLSTDEMDLLYSLPYTRRAHPSYQEPVPGLATVATSITSHRAAEAGAASAPWPCTRAAPSPRAPRTPSWPRWPGSAPRRTGAAPSATSAAPAPTCGGGAAPASRPNAPAPVASPPSLAAISRWTRRPSPACWSGPPTRPASSISGSPAGCAST